MLKKERLEELKEIIKEDFGKNLNDRELFEFGSRLLSYFELLARINFQDQLSNSKKKTVKGEIKFDLSEKFNKIN